MSELENLLTETDAIAHLATAVDDRPHVAPVWYGYEDGVVSILTGGQKRANARENPLVSISIQEANDGVPEWRVVLRGTASVIDDVTAINEAARWIYPQYIGDDVESWPPVYRSALSDDPNESLLRVDIGSASLMS
ncbi:MAG: pyridoxamine 5'-phosphate oxidase family protein [Salinirussus sp.]